MKIVFNEVIIKFFYCSMMLSESIIIFEKFKIKIGKNSYYKSVFKGI